MTREACTVNPIRYQGRWRQAGTACGKNTTGEDTAHRCERRTRAHARIAQVEIGDPSTATSNEVGSTAKVRAMSIRAPSDTPA